MDMKVTTFDGGEAGSVTLSDAIFGLEPRPDILQRCVVWQLSRRQAGTHKVKNRAEVWRTGKKMYRQKGTGGARHGSQRVNLFRGGGRSFGPVVRSHAIDLPKKVRALALRHALSAKARDGGIIVVDQVSADGAKTKALRERFGKLGLANALIVDGAEVNRDFALAARNIPHVDVLPVQGINVYDIMRREKLVLTRAALEAIEARFSGAKEDGGFREILDEAGERVRDVAASVGDAIEDAADSARALAGGVIATVGSAVENAVERLRGSDDTAKGENR